MNESQSAFLRLVKVRWGRSGKFISKDLPSWTKIGRWSQGALLGVYINVNGGYCEDRRRRVSEGREVGRRIDVEDCEVGA